MSRPERHRIVKARLVAAEEVKEPGDFTWLCSASDDLWPTAILFMCPCKCGKLSQIALDVLANVDLSGPKWTWDRDAERPTMKEQIIKEDGCFSALNLIQGSFVVR